MRDLQVLEFLVCKERCDQSLCAAPAAPAPSGLCIMGVWVLISMRAIKHSNMRMFVSERKGGRLAA